MTPEKALLETKETARTALRFVAGGAATALIGINRAPDHQP
jgi:hypothetical protein